MNLAALHLAEINTLSRMTLSRKRFSRMTLSRKTFSRMTISRKTFSRMTPGGISLQIDIQHNEPQ
jgi:hypothetical protein